MRPPTFFSTPFFLIDAIGPEILWLFMSRSIVTLTKWFPITRPLTLLIFDPKEGFGGFVGFSSRKKSYEDSASLSWDLAQVHRTAKGFPEHI